MSWKLSGKPVTMKATKKLAEEWAAMDPPPKERALSERRLQVYEILVGRKKFRPVVWAKAYCAETGGLCRVNGQHTSNLIARLEPTPELFVTLESYNCDTLEDVADLYATFDSKMQSRTVKDINLSFAGTCPELKEMPDRLINLSVAGMAYGLWGERYTHGHQPADRAELLLEHTDFVIWLNTILAGPDNGPLADGAKLLFRAAPVAAMFVTWKLDQAKATEFWSAVRQQTGAAPDLPDRKLAAWLMTTNVTRGSKSFRGKKATSGREFYVRCLKCWNAWRKGKAVDFRYEPAKEIPDPV